MKQTSTTIHLGLYGKTAAKTIKLLFAGLKESLDWREKDSSKLGRSFTGRITTVSVDPTGEVVLNVNHNEFLGRWADYYKDRIPTSAFARGIDIAYIKNWISAELLRRAGNVSSMEKMQLHPASKTSQTSRGWEVCATARALAGEDVKTIYGQKIFDVVVGQMADPVSVEVAEVIDEETKRIVKEFKVKQQELHMALLLKIDAIRNDYRRKLAELGKQQRAAITAMKKQMAAV